METTLPTATFFENGLPEGSDAVKSEHTLLPRKKGPFRDVQILNCPEVAIASNKDQPVPLRRRHNPDVVLGERSPLLLKTLL